MKMIPASSVVAGCCVTLALLAPQAARGASWTSNLGLVVVPSSGPAPPQVSVSTTNVVAPLSDGLGGSGACPGPGCAFATGTVIVSPSPSLHGLVTGDAAAQEQVAVAYSLQMSGLMFAGPGVGTGFLGLLLDVDGTQTNDDNNSSSLVVGRLDVGSTFAGGGNSATCTVRLSRPLFNPGSDPVHGSCLDIVPVSFGGANDLSFTQVMSMNGIGHATADFLSTALISSVELFDADMHSLGHVTLSEGGVQIPAGVAAPVPEPDTFAVVALGMIGIGFARRRKTH